MVDQSIPVTTSEQQAAPVAQIDRDAAATLEAILRDVWDGYSSVHAIREGCADGSSIVQAFARHRLAATSLHDMQITPALSLPCKSGEGAGLMKPWRGGDSAPSDWNGGPVVMVDPSDLSGDAFVEVNVPPREMPWKRRVGWKVIVAYTPIPDATQTREAEEDDDERLTGEEAWDVLVNVDDRTSPEKYPDMCLITRDELIEFMSRATSPSLTLSMDLRALGQAIGAEIDRQCSIGAGTCGTADDGSGLFEVNASLDLNGFAQAMFRAALNVRGGA